MIRSRLTLGVFTAIAIFSWSGVDAHRAQGAKLTLQFMPPATPTNPDGTPAKTAGPGNQQGWGALVLMFSGPVTAAQFKIEDSPCAVFMDVPGFVGPADTITIVPAAGEGGYKIPVKHKVSVMVTSDNDVTLKPGAGSPPTPSFWRFKTNNNSTSNQPAKAVPEPAASALTAFALAILLKGRRRTSL